jgi:release factor glutamine methyltransferase
MSPNFTINQIRKQIKQTLAGLYDENEIRNFTNLLFHHLLNYSKIDIQLKGDDVISQYYIDAIKESLVRLGNFEPIQYILGRTVFFDLPLVVTPDVLIPRPETEELVDWIIRENEGKKIRILDIGTGSGCIALALAKKLPLAKVTGIDVSEKALEKARKNAILNNADVDFFRFDIIKQSSDLKGEFDIMVSNPPYVRECEKKFMQPNVLNYEPHQALFVPDDNPLLFYKAIANLGHRILAENGNIYCEINEALPEETTEIFRSMNYPVTEVRRDINGKPRMIKARKKQ